MRPFATWRTATTGCVRALAMSFVKVNEFLAIERNHATTLRDSTGGAVWAELEMVRRRYAVWSEPSRQERIRRHRVRTRLWNRVYWVSLLALSCVPRRLRHGPWSRMLASGHLDIRRLPLAMRPIPWLGRRYTGRVIKPSRYWLAPVSDV